jgi:hypothetical protein
MNSTTTGASRFSPGFASGISVMARFSYRVLRMLILLVGGVLGACTAGSTDKALAVGGDVDSGTMDDANGGMSLDFSMSCTAEDCRNLVLEGAVESGVPTWHRRAEGVALVGDRVVMQSVDDFAAHPDRDVNCYLIRLMGAWDSSVTLRVRIEGEYGLFGIAEYEDPMDEALQNIPEGDFEFTEVVNGGDWKPWEMLVRAIKVRGQMTFRIEKEGEGDARFLYIQISGEADCDDGAVEVD